MWKSKVCRSNCSMHAIQKPSLTKAISMNGIFVEVGTWEGNFAYELLTQTECSKLYCVDPYKHFDDSIYPDAINSLTQEQFNDKYNGVCRRFSEFGNRVEFIRKTSNDAALQFKDESLDFVYIDGNHEFQSVLLDILVWYPKVKKGGFLCGDDVYSTDLNEHDADGNIMRGDYPVCWGKYGTYTAVVKAKAILNYEFTIEQTQFIIHKK